MPVVQDWVLIVSEETHNSLCFPGGTEGCMSRLKFGKAVRVKECWITSAASERKKLLFVLGKWVQGCYGMVSEDMVVTGWHMKQGVTITVFGCGCG